MFEPKPANDNDEELRDEIMESRLSSDDKEELYRLLDDIQSGDTSHWLDASEDCTPSDNTYSD